MSERASLELTDDRLSDSRASRPENRPLPVHADERRPDPDAVSRRTRVHWRPQLNKTLAICIFLLLMIPFPASAQSATWKFQDRDYFNPLSSEPRAARTTVDFPGLSDSFPFSKTDQPTHLVWEITLGREIPIWGKQTQNRSNDSPALRRPGDWGFGIWFPVSFHMIEYMDGDSNPIVNTDYRAGGMLKATTTIANGLDLHARFSLGHESTHLGDEFTIFAEDLHDDFERINVSWEYWELAAGLDSSSFSARAGFIDVIGDDGFYSAHPLETVEIQRTIPVSTRNYEWWGGLEYRPSTPECWDYRLFASADLRHRTVYDYHRRSDVDNEAQLSLNFLLGFRTRVESGRRILREFFFRFYHGVNPHGQFRTERDYTYFGAGVRFGFDF